MSHLALILVGMATTKISTPAGIDAVYYMVKDLARARRFYEEGLGFVSPFVTESGEWSGAEYLLPTGQTFGLGRAAQAQWRPSGGAMIAVDDVAQATARVTEFGGNVIAETFESPVCTMSWCEDTEGNTFCLHRRKDGTVG